jgi:hypothetical protein
MENPSVFPVTIPELPEFFEKAEEDKEKSNTEWLVFTLRIETETPQIDNTTDYHKITTLIITCLKMQWNKNGRSFSLSPSPLFKEASQVCYMMP